MPEPAIQLITEAYFSSGIRARDFEQPSDTDITYGLRFLNDILGEKVCDENMVPYETTFSLTVQTGVEKYFIPNLIKIDTIAFFLEGVRFALQYTQRNSYFGSPRVNTVLSLPGSWYFERQLGGGNLYLYFFPDQNYPFEIHGIFRLPEVTLFSDLSTYFDRFYITYLKYALANRLCAEFSYSTPPNVRDQLLNYENKIRSKTRLIDLRMQKVSTLGNNYNWSWASVNISPAFMPG